MQSFSASIEGTLQENTAERQAKLIAVDSALLGLSRWHKRRRIDKEASNLPLPSVLDHGDLDSCVSFLKRCFGCISTCGHSAGLPREGHGRLTLRWLALL